jgi:hypothetical protein
MSLTDFEGNNKKKEILGRTPQKIQDFIDVSKAWGQFRASASFFFFGRE